MARMGAPARSKVHAMTFTSLAGTLLPAQMTLVSPEILEFDKSTCTPVAPEVSPRSESILAIALSFFRK